MTNRSLAGPVVALAVCFASIPAPSSRSPRRPFDSRTTGLALAQGRQGAQPARDRARAAAGTAVIRGRVYAADTGAPLRRARVNWSSDVPVPTIAGQVPRVMTDNEGRYEIRDLPAGRYRVYAKRTGYLQMDFGARRGATDSRALPTGAQRGVTIELADGQVFDRADFRLPRAGAITGRILDEYGDPLISAFVGASRQQTTNGRRRLVGVASDMTDDLGEFRLAGLPPGSYYVVATAPGGGASSYADMFYPGVATREQARPVTIREGQEAADISFMLSSIRKARISGTLLTSRGTVPNGVGVRFSLARTTDIGNVATTSYLTLLTAEGAFTLTGVPPGDCDLVVTASTEGGVTEVAAVPLRQRRERRREADRRLRHRRLSARPVTLASRLVVDQDRAAEPARRVPRRRSSARRLLCRRRAGRGRHGLDGSRRAGAGAGRKRGGDRRAGGQESSAVENRTRGHVGAELVSARWEPAMRLVILAFALVLPFAPARLKPCPTDVLFAQQQQPPVQQQGRPGVADPRATPGREAKETGVIRGRVVNAGTGRPLRQVNISAREDNVTLRSLFTDENGQFECKGLSAGRYQLRASLVGYVPLDFREDPETGGGQEIALGNAETFDKADFRLPRGGVISGRIVDEAGEPLEGVQVQVLTMQYVGGMDRLTPFTPQGQNRRSNDIGRYRIFGLPPGDYYVAATPGAFNMSALANGDMAPGYAVTYYPGSADVANAQKLTVSAGQETQADFPVVPARAFDLTGIALDSSGRPLGGAVLLLAAGTNASSALVARASTNMDGTFTFSSVPAGPYTLQLQPMSSMPPPPGGAEPGRPSQPLFASMVVNVAANVPSITIQGRPGRTGTFEIVTEDGRPSPDVHAGAVHITARPVDFTRSPMIGFGSPWAIDKDANYELFYLWGPRVVDADDLPPGWGLKAVRAGGADMTDKPIDFDRDPGRVQVVLTGQVTEISGNVTDEGRAAAGAPVIVFASDSSRWDFQSRYLRLVHADDNGRFSVSALPATEYRVVALARVKSGNSWQRPDFLEPLARAGSRVVLHDGEHTNVDLKVVR